jgi:hypothetical protein
MTSTLRLLYMVMCERVILEREDNSASLINLLEGVTLQLSEDLPAEAEIPQRWGVYSMWRRERVGGTQGFVQRMEMISPSGRIVKENEITFTYGEGKHNHKVKLTVDGLPIGEHGVWSVNLSIKEDSADSQWSLAGSLPFHVTHERVKREESAAEAANEVG